MENIVWDTTPSTRVTKKEQFTTAVVTMSALAGKGAGRKFTFNKAAQELLNVEGEDRVSFGFTPDGYHIYIRKASGETGFQLTKTCSFSDKKTFEFISKRLELDNNVENHFDIVNAPMEGNIFELILRTPMTEMVEGFANATEVVEFKSMDLGTITCPEDSGDEVPNCPQPEPTIEEERVSIADLADEDVEETAETLDLSTHIESEEETDEWA
jgi:hypothetical protein